MHLSGGDTVLDTLGPTPAQYSGSYRPAEEKRSLLEEDQAGGGGRDLPKELQKLIRHPEIRRAFGLLNAGRIVSRMELSSRSSKGVGKCYCFFLYNSK